ncbi:hypothetical protein [Peptostreptococcus faecalis]|uniref:hypothetical protein n=1 Tax=Peptostreptococcus faecalis TaxID=2045015 RepID=UPI000C7CCA8F|nr:hypothetical protein [Peptostreptococcus faecalis]
MSFKFDREIMKWFDLFFEDQKNLFNMENFLCSMQEINNTKKNGNLITLEKQDSNYWKLEFSLPENYVIKLQKNVHPFFGEYIYEEISIYCDDNMYDFLNYYLMKVLDNVVLYTYDIESKTHYINYKDSFLRKCKYMESGKKRFLDEDLYIVANSDRNFDFVNFSGTFKLNLCFDPNKGENLLDSILNIRKSIIISE